MLNRFSVALFLYTKNKSYKKLATLAARISSGLASMSTLYSSPFPTLLTFDGQIAALQAAIILWGDSRGSHGSSADKLNVEAAAEVVRTSLIQLSQYVMDTDPQNPVNWGNVGFTVKAVPSATVPFNEVQNLRKNLRATNLTYGQIGLKWNKPLNAVGKRVNSYSVRRASVNDFSQSSEVGISTRTSFAVTPPVGEVSYYWVIPYNAAGAGAIADSLTITVGPAI